MSEGITLNKMAKSIYKYVLKIEDQQNLLLPDGSEILSIQVQDGKPCVWVLLDPSEKEMEAHIIETFGTGHDISYDMGSSRVFIGTYQIGGFVGHVFRYTGV